MKVPSGPTLPVDLATSTVRCGDANDAPNSSGGFAAMLSNAASATPTTPVARVQQYDLRRITYAGMAELGRALVNSGALPESKLLDFIPLRPGGVRVDGGPTAFGPDVPIDMVQRQRDLIRSQESAGVEQRFLEHSRSVLKMYEDLVDAGSRGVVVPCR